MPRASAWAIALLIAAAPALSSERARAQASGEPLASSASEDLSRATAALEEQQYERAIDLASGAKRSPRPATRVRALQMIATAYLLDGRPSDARPALEELYDLAPGFLLDDPSLPPRVTSAFDTEAARPHARTVVLRVGEVPDDALAFTINASGSYVRIDGACRRRTSAAFAPVTLGTSAFRLPSNEPYRCYAVALDVADLPLGRLGSHRDPVELAPHPKRVAERGLLDHWWFWTGLGVVAVGSASAVFFATRSEEASPPGAELTVRGQSAGVSW